MDTVKNALILPLVMALPDLEDMQHVTPTHITYKLAAPCSKSSQTPQHNLLRTDHVCSLIVSYHTKARNENVLQISGPSYFLGHTLKVNKFRSELTTMHSSEKLISTNQQDHSHAGVSAYQNLTFILSVVLESSTKPLTR